MFDLVLTLLCWTATSSDIPWLEEEEEEEEEGQGKEGREESPCCMNCKYCRHPYIPFASPHISSSDSDSLSLFFHAVVVVARIEEQSLSSKEPSVALFKYCRKKRCELFSWDSFSGNVPQNVLELKAIGNILAFQRQRSESTTDLLQMSSGQTDALYVVM